MSNYLRDVLGADNSSSEFAQPQGLVADAGPDLPGGEGANEGAWRDQLRDRLGQWAKMLGLVLFDIDIEGIGRITGHGELIDIVRPGVGLVRVKNHKILGDMDIEILGEQLESIDAVIPEADYERVTGKDVTPNTEPAPELKDEVTGDEALQKIYGQMGLHAKKSGRFAVGRSVKDVRDAAKETYKPVYEKLKDEYPELMTEFPDYESYWNYASNSLAAGVFTRWADSVDDIPELTKASNKIYAREILGLKEDGFIEFYRNSVNHKSSPELAGAGYASLDRRMAWDYNSYLIKYADNGLNENDGRYIVKAKPDEVTGLLGLSGAEDEYGVVIGLDVTSQPGRTTRVGDLEMQQVAPWSNDIQTFDRSGGGSPFRRVSPASQFEVFATENPLPGDGYGDFYEAFGLDKESRPIPTKWDEMFGEGSFDALNGDYPSFRSMQSLFVDAGDGKVGLDMMQLDQISSRDSQNPEANDTYDKTLKMLSVIQELSGKTFMVHRGHNPDDPRIPDEPVDTKEESSSETNKLDAPLTPQNFTDEQEEVVKDYSSYGYRDVNTYLRLGRQGAIDEFATTNAEKRADEAEKAIEEINKVFETSTLEKDATLFRLVPRDIAENVKVGEILSDPAILSTTKNPESDDINRQFNSNIFNGLERYYEDKYDGAHPNDVGWAVIEIEAPAGTKAIDITDISEFPEEREVLLPSDASLEVISIEETEGIKNRYKRPGDIFKAYKIKVRVAPVSKNDTAAIDPDDLGLTVNGRSELRSIKTRLGGEIFDPSAVKLINQYSGSDSDVKKLDAALFKTGIYRKRDLFSDAYTAAVRSAISDYKKIDPNLNTERKARKAMYGGLNGTELGVIGYLQPGVFTKIANNFDYSNVSDKDKLSAAREEIAKNGFIDPITVLYNPNTYEYSLENTQDSLKILAAREIKDPNIKIRAIPTVVKVSADSDSFDKDTELNPIFFDDLDQPSAWVADIQVKPEEYYDLSEVEDLPIPDRTDFEKEAIDFYQRGTYLTLKNYLQDPSSAGDDAEKLGKIVDTLNKLGNSEKLPANTELFRGFRLSADSDLYRYYSSLKPGDVLADPNRFSSTSLDPIVAEDFATLGGKKDDYTGSVVLEVSTEDGATGVVFGNNEDTYASGIEVALASEKEVLLPFAAELKIDKIFKDSDGILRIQAKYGKKVKSDSEPGKRITSSDGSSEDFWNTDKTPGELKSEVAAETARIMLDNGISVKQLDALNQKLVSMYDTGTNDPYVSEWEGSAPYGQIMVTEGAFGFVPLARALVRFSSTAAELKSMSSTGDFNLTMDDVKKILEKANSSEDALSEFRLYQELTDSERAKMAVSTLITDWASSSNGNNPRSLALQEIAEIVFDTKNARDWKSPPKTKAEIEKIKQEYGGMLSAFLQAQYEQTQKRFKEAGITEVVLYRGIDDVALGKTLSDDKLTEVDVQSRPLSSWSTSDGTAYWFATGGSDSEASGEDVFDPESDHRGAVLLRRVVPVDQILSSSFTGVGSYDEQEMVIIGGEMKAEAVGAVKENKLIQVMREREGSTWNPLTGLETSAEKQERIEPGFENWNKEVEKIFEDWDNDLIAGVEIYDAGNILQANFIKKAGFNEKPKVLSQEEFDAIEAETVYRGHQSIAFMNNYIDSELQFASEGYFGNGTYTSNKRETAEAYAGGSGPDPLTQAEIDEHILEMKLLPDANVISFGSSPALREWAEEKTTEFLEGYEKSGANPAQYQEAEWRLFNEADYTNIAIMLGIDAIRFKFPLTDAEEYYTIILNRGKVAINGKS